jgi:hypothetical protein
MNDELNLHPVTLRRTGPAGSVRPVVSPPAPRSLLHRARIEQASFRGVGDMIAMVGRKRVSEAHPAAAAMVVSRSLFRRSAQHGPEKFLVRRPARR